MYVLFFCFSWSQNISDTLKVININKAYIKDFNIKSRKFSDILYLNNQLNDHIRKHKKNIKTISINTCNLNYSNHDIERFNKMMVYPIENTPECIFSFYSSLEYGR